jgi:rfaE bifunctional protein kinase chain/domain
MKADALAAIVQRFRGRKVALCGDLVVDAYVYGRTQRVSREAPVLVVRYVDHELRPGAGANAAANLAALGARVAAVGVVGRDPLGGALRELLREHDVKVERLCVAPDRITACKTRILAGDLNTTRQQMLRIDREGAGPLPEAVEAQLERSLRAALRGAHALLLSDYGHGAVTARVIALARAAARRGLVVCADSRHNVSDYRGIPWVTPNEPETALATGIDIEAPGDVRRAARRLLAITRGAGALITRGARGLALATRGAKTTFLPPFGSAELADATGAGDTVASVFVLALASGATPDQAAVLANLGGGIVVAKRGTATVTAPELIDALSRWSAGRR